MNRRGFLLGALAAPVIVKAASLMPVRRVLLVPTYEHQVIKGVFEVPTTHDLPEYMRDWMRYFEEASLKHENDYIYYDGPRLP